MFRIPLRLLSIAIVATMLRAGATQAQVRLRGTVTDSAGVPLPSIRVTIDSSTTVLTDGSGAFAVPNVAPGDHFIRFERVGVRPRFLRFDLPSDVAQAFDLGVIQLELLATELEPIVVRAERYYQNIPGNRELAQLQRAGLGHMVTPEAIDRINPLTVGDIYLRIPGVTFSVSEGLARFVGDGGTVLCPRGAMYVVDGVRTFWPRMFTDPERQIKSVWGYRGAFDKCGVIVIETNGISTEETSEVEFGIRGSGTVRNGSGQFERLGGYVVIPVSRHVDVYPAAEAMLRRRAGWNLQFAFRVRPTADGPFYVGAGLAVGRDYPAEEVSIHELQASPILLSGVASGFGPLRLSVELRAVDLVGAGSPRLAALGALGVRFGHN